MILNTYRFFICCIMAVHMHAWLNYVVNDVTIPMSSAVWATAFTVLFLFERLYITIRMEHEARSQNARMDKD